jgi:hypothetical protein
MTTLTTATVILFSAATLLACGSSGPASEPNTTDSKATGGEQVLYTETIVRFAPDGTTSETVNLLTASEIAAERESRLQYIAAKHSGQKVPERIIQATCAQALVEFWDQPNAGGNTICFYNDVGTPASANLASYLRGTGGNRWNGAVRSYTGDAGGNGTSCDGEDGNFGNFGGPGNSYQSCGESFSCFGYAAGYKNAIFLGCAYTAVAFELLN